ncbi:MAG TPA: hypothetical protein EYP18_02475, partial [Desulfobacterales bacterium]|nr:hypothetical protein [Desulfobacterales bacterium]
PYTTFFRSLEWKPPDGCATCRPALNYYLLANWPEEYHDDPQSRFINERAHGNIQKDGTYSVVPRMFGGLCTPSDLRAIADVAEKYQVPEMKVTGGQRIDLFGVKKEDLPAMWQDLTETVTAQIITLLDAGVDALIVETCQDLLQIKTSLIACFELLNKEKIDIPVMASVTFEQQGTMLVGTDIAAVCATIAPFPVFSLGLNRATGPTDMEPHIDYLCNNWKKRISCIPNQGMPEVVNGKTHYPLTPVEYGEHMFDFVTNKGVSIVGGCCGTSPEHTKALVKALKNAVPADRTEVLK